MTGRGAVVVFVLGTAWVQHWSALPPRPLAWGCLLLAGLWSLGCWCRAACLQRRDRAGCHRRRLWQVAGLWGAAWGLAIGLAHLQALDRMAQSLPASEQDQVFRVTLRVVSLPDADAGQVRFEAEVLDSRPAGLPGRIQVAWYAPGYRSVEGAVPDGGQAGAESSLPEVVPGQVWRMALNMRSPHGSRNPHGFDYEGWIFQKAIRAVGTVRGTPVMQDRHVVPSWSIRVQQVRHAVRAGMQHHLAGSRYGAVLVALALGDQAGVPAQDWATFNRSGITHLVSISGLHVTMVAALGGGLALYLWKRLSWRGVPLAARCPAQIPAACCALWVAWLYCLLAGWGVPAQRTFFMLAVVAVCALLQLPLSLSRVLALAAVIVLLFDPWAVLAQGFWLSFGAVGVLMLASQGRWLSRDAAQVSQRTLHSGRDASGEVPGTEADRAWQEYVELFSPPAIAVSRAERWNTACCHVARQQVSSLWQGTRLQLAISMALVPVLAAMFQQVPLLSPLANALAIPLVSFLVTPLALIGAALGMLPAWGQGMAAHVLDMGQAIFAALMLWIDWLSSFEAGLLDTAAAPWWLTLLGVVGAIILLLPAGVFGKLCGVTLLMPALFWRPEAMAPGSWSLTALDVGQGSAIVVATARHALLFDTGLPYGPGNDAGERVVYPYLRASGITGLDVLVVSHADSDHAGGLPGLLRHVPVRYGFASFDLAAQRLPADAGLPLHSLPCRAGMHWELDGVRFRFLHPQGTDALPIRSGNAQSCVLQVEGQYHRALLTGDIGVQEERLLVENEGQQLRSEVVLAGHHGARTSSGNRFVRATAARHVIAQSGRFNRFGHPHPDVEQRWQQAGARFWRTDLEGAVTVRSDATGLAVQAERQRRRRYWQGSMP
ncbi:DNA internalization-related competence protein ComEC/Rec2 [Alcaligenaceae bacterium SJ-26]|nr:DNA internalization-related competence protein ComEC/Rec2 [Alcaligenaceae bacterium SJ-26]